MFSILYSSIAYLFASSRPPVLLSIHSRRRARFRIPEKKSYSLTRAACGIGTNARQVAREYLAQCLYHKQTRSASIALRLIHFQT